MNNGMSSLCPCVLRFIEQSSQRQANFIIYCYAPSTTETCCVTQPLNSSGYTHTCTHTHARTNTHTHTHSLAENMESAEHWQSWSNDKKIQTSNLIEHKHTHKQTNRQTHTNTCSLAERDFSVFNKLPQPLKPQHTLHFSPSLFLRLTQRSLRAALNERVQ